MSRAKQLPALLLLPLLLAVAGCGAQSATRTAPPLGRGIEAKPPPVQAAPAPVGDPASERHGSPPAASAGAEDTPTARGPAATPQDALRRYALDYTNWNATSLAAHERQLATLAIGPARLAALQTAAALVANSQLVNEHVRNTGAVLAIAAGEGPAQGEWVVVTQEQTTGSGSYAGLPVSPHVTRARVTRTGGGWVVWGWWPES
jgi:hypothetical protein